MMVSYKSAGQVLVDLGSGVVDAGFRDSATVLAHIQSGRLKALAVTAANRYPPLPKVPTVAEAGYPTFESRVWIAYFAPAGTPKDIVARLHTETAVNCGFKVEGINRAKYRD